MSMNERGAYYHLLGDAGASVAVVVSMLAVRFTGFTIVDPLTAILITGLIILSAVERLRKSGVLFSQQSPVEPEQLRNALNAIERVEDLRV